MHCSPSARPFPGLEICDYLQQGESAADAVERMRELVGSVAAEAAPRELEQPAGARFMF